jgi:hypothetical protein
LFILNLTQTLQHTFIPRHSQDLKRTNALRASAILTNSLSDSINFQVSHAFRNQKALEIETRKLQNAIQKQHERNAEWIKMLNEWNDAVKVEFLM